MSKVFYVALSKRFPLPIAASGIWEKEKEPVACQRQGQPKTRTPSREHLIRRTSVHNNNHWIAALRIVVLRVNEPSLYIQAFICPCNTLCLSPPRLYVCVRMRNLFPLTDRA